MRMLVVVGGDEVVEVCVLPYVDQMPIVDACAPDRLCVDAETELPHKMKWRASSGRKTSNIAGVRRDFRLDQNQMEWPFEFWAPKAWRTVSCPGHALVLGVQW